MIRMPYRSITRFFIPLVDVMILMFSIFLLMPIMQQSSEIAAGVTEDVTNLTEARQRLRSAETAREFLAGEVKRLSEEVSQLRKYAQSQKEFDRLQTELKRLRSEKIDTLQKFLFIRVLEIDPNTGKLLYYDQTQQPPKKIVVENARQAQELIRQHQEAARAAGKELYYLFLFPRVDSAYPEYRQFDRYRSWFNSVAYGVDRPMGMLSSGGK